MNPFLFFILFGVSYYSSSVLCVCVCVFQLEGIQLISLVPIYFYWVFVWFLFGCSWILCGLSWTWLHAFLPVSEFTFVFTRPLKADSLPFRMNPIRFLPSLLGLTRFDWVSLGFIRFLLHLTEFNRVFTQFSWIFLAFHRRSKLKLVLIHFK